MFVDAAVKRQAEGVLSDVHLHVFGTQVGLSGNEQALRKFERGIRSEMGLDPPATRIQRALRPLIAGARKAP